MRHFGPQLNSKVIPSSQPVKAQFDITITRNSGNITNDLEVAVLGFTEIISGYNSFINPVVGGTVTVTGGIYNALPDRYRFTHVSGANTDTIDITCAQHPYPSLLQSSGFDLYKIDNIRYSVTDQTIADTQFNNKFTFSKQTIFGLEKNNPLSVISFKNPMNNQDNIIDIPVSMVMDKETCIVLGVAPPGDNDTNEFTLSFFVSMYQKYDAQLL